MQTNSGVIKIRNVNVIPARIRANSKLFVGTATVRQ